MSGFESVVRGNGFAVNLVTVIALAAIGVAFLTGRREVIRPALAAFVLLCLADWVLVEDFGFLGGLGTDPNSMIPMALLAVGGGLALTPAAEPVAVAVAGTAGTATATLAAAAGSGPAAGPDTAGPDTAGSDTAGPDTAGRNTAGPGGAEPGRAGTGWRERVGPAALHRWVTAATFGTMISLGAFGVIVLGAVPMAAAQATPAASTILAESIDGPASPINIPAPDFTLTDQNGKPVTLSSLRGQVVLLTFLDPVCVSDCPLIAQEFRQAGQLLGPGDPHVKLIAIDVNPLYSQINYVRAFDRQENLGGVADWRYLTSSPARLRQVYHRTACPRRPCPRGRCSGTTTSRSLSTPTASCGRNWTSIPGPARQPPSRPSRPNSPPQRPRPCTARDQQRTADNQAARSQAARSQAARSQAARSQAAQTQPAQGQAVAPEGLGPGATARPGRGAGGWGGAGRRHWARGMRQQRVPPG